MVAKIDSSLQYELKKCLGISAHVLKNIAPKDLDSLPNRHCSQYNKLLETDSLLDQHFIM